MDDGPERLAGSIHRAIAWAASRIRLLLKQFSLEMLSRRRGRFSNAETQRGQSCSR
jgi:hypothetical protein